MFNKEQLEDMISTLKENVVLTESLLAKNPNDEDLKKLFQSQQNTLNDYKQRLETIKVGRPSLGVTKKVSLTLSEEDWQWVDDHANGNRSQFFRYLINQEQSPEGRWSNNASLGYAILGAKKLGYDDEQITQLVRAIYGQFDLKSVEEAKTTYNESSY